MMAKDYMNNVSIAFGLILYITGLLATQAGGAIIINPRDTKVSEGNTTVLYCEVKVQNASQPQCIWAKGSISVQMGERYSFTGDPTTGLCNLQISDAQSLLDDDSWKCSIPASGSYGGESSSSAKLDVLVTPSAPIIYDEGVPTPNGGNISIDENERETITCTVRHGNPVPNLTWTLDGQPLTPTNDKVESEESNRKTFKRTITYDKEFSKDYSGKILRCLLMHETMSMASSVDAIISVSYTTTIVELSTPEYVVVDYGMPYTFSCKADGNPDPSYEWMFQSSDGKSTIVSNSPDYVLAAATDANAGSYTCLAGNDGLIPTAAVSFEIRDKGISTAGIVGIVIGAVFIVAIGVLMFLVIHLRKRLRNKDNLASMPKLNELNITPPMRHNNTYHFNRNLNGASAAYMVPLPNEMAPLRPDSGDEFERDKGSHVYMEPQYACVEPSRPPPRKSPPPLPKSSPPPRTQLAASYLELTSVTEDYSNV